MGSILSRRIAGVEDIDIQANSAYRYPPKSGEWPRRTGAAGLGSRSSSEGGLGALLGPRPFLQLPCMELHAPSIRTPGRGSVWR